MNMLLGMEQNNKFNSAIENAIASVAKLLGKSDEEIAKQAMTEGPVRDSVMLLTFASAQK